MDYYFNALISSSYDDAIEKVKADLNNEGIGIITEIDVKKILKEKLGVEFRNYRILGTCDPTLAHNALMTESKIGALLPCNVVVQEKENGDIEVSAVDPVASMLAVKNEEMQAIAKRMQEKLQKVIEGL